MPVLKGQVPTNDICHGCNHSARDLMQQGQVCTESSGEAAHTDEDCQSGSHKAWRQKVCSWGMGGSKSVGASLAQP